MPNAVPSADAVVDYVESRVPPQGVIASWMWAANIQNIPFLNLAGWDEISITGSLTIATYVAVQVSPDNGVTWRTAGYLGRSFDDASGLSFTTEMRAEYGSGAGERTFDIKLTDMADPLRKTSFSGVELYLPTSRANVSKAVYNTPELCTAIRFVGTSTPNGYTGGYIDVRGVRRAALADQSALVLAASLPAHNSAGFDRAGNILLNFNKAIQFNTGVVTLRQEIASVWSDLEAFDVVTEVGAADGQISILGASATLNPTLPLVGGRRYAIRVAATAIRDAAGNAFAGIANDTTLVFTTEVAQAPFIVFLSVDGNTVNHTLSGPGTIHWSLDDAGLPSGAVIDAGTGAYAFGNFAGSATPGTTVLDFTGAPAGARRLHFVVTTVGDVNYGTAQHFNVTVVVAGAPVNTVRPAITGVTQSGQVLTAANFVFTGTGPFTYAYRWLRNGVDITGQTSVTYTAVAADVSNGLQVAVRATDPLSRQSDWIFSDAVNVELAPLAFTVQPTTNLAVYVQGATVTLTLGTAPLATTLAIKEFTIAGTDRRAELVAVNATTFTWDSTAKPTGAIRYQVEASNASQAQLSNLIIATLNAAAIVVPSVIADGDWNVINQGAGGVLIFTVLVAPANGGSGILGYEYQKDGVGNVALGIAIPGSVNLSGFSLTVASGYKLRAINSAGAGPWSATTKNATAADILAPETIPLTYNATVNEVSVSTSELAIKYYLINQSATPLTGANIKAQVLAATPAAYGTINIGVTEVTPNMTPITVAGVYFLHIGSQDATGNVEALGEVFEFDWAGTVDAVAPVLSLATSLKNGTTAFTGTVTTSKTGGTLSFIASTSITAASPAQIEAGQMNTGAAAAAFGAQSVAASGLQSVAGAALAPATGYYLQYFHRSASGVASNVIVSPLFTTDAATGAVEVVTSTLMINTTASATSFASATDHVVSSQANRAVFLHINGLGTVAGAPPTLSNVLFGGVAATLVQAPAGASGKEWSALYVAVNPAAGARACSMDASSSQNAFSVRAVECKNVNQAVPVEGSAIVTSGSSFVATLAFTRTVVSGGNMLLSRIGIESGGLQAELSVTGGATLIAAEQTGTSTSSDITDGTSYEAAPSAGANGHTYNWTTVKRASLSWAEVRKA